MSEVQRHLLIQVALLLRKGQRLPGQSFVVLPHGQIAPLHKRGGDIAGGDVLSEDHLALHLHQVTTELMFHHLRIAQVRWRSEPGLPRPAPLPGQRIFRPLAIRFQDRPGIEFEAVAAEIPGLCGLHRSGLIPA